MPTTTSPLDLVSPAAHELLRRPPPYFPMVEMIRPRAGTPAAIQAVLLKRGAAALATAPRIAACIPSAQELAEREVLRREGEALAAHLERSEALAAELNEGERLFQGPEGRALAEEMRAEIAGL